MGGIWLIFSNKELLIPKKIIDRSRENFQRLRSSTI
jgi:hypothetical protein